MSLQVFDDFINRIGGGFFSTQPVWGEAQTAGTASLVNSTSGSLMRIGDTLAIPNPLATGVTAKIVTGVIIGCSASTIGSLLCKAINLGTFDIGAANTGVFTDGSAMPSQTVFGTASTSLPAAVIVECTTATAGTQTLITVTYKNQAGTAGQTTTFTPGTSVVARSCGFLNAATGDWGVTDITAIARASSAGPTGVLKFWGIVPISFTTNLGGNMATIDNLVTAGVNIIRLSAGDSLQVFSLGTLVARAEYGQIFFVDDN